MTASENKQDYRNLCRKRPDIPLFLQDWWLDSVCGKEAWEVLLARNKDNSIRGAWPYHCSRRWFWSMIRPLTLSPYGGVWFNYPSSLLVKDSFEKKVINELVDQLPEVAFFIQDFLPDFTNWLPFYWKGFRQTTRYTYRIETPWEEAKVFEGFESSVRNKIRKAQRQLKLRSGSLEEFYRLNTLTFRHQGMSIPYSLEFLQRLEKELAFRQQRQILIATDEQGRDHAGLYLVWDHQIAYNLMLGADPDLRSSGAVQLLIWEAIQMAGEKRLIFDFEGSMLPPIEQLFRSFGARRQAYFRIYKANRWWGDWVREMWAGW